MQYKDRPLLQRRLSLDSSRDQKDPNAKLKALARTGSFNEGHKALVPPENQQIHQNPDPFDVTESDDSSSDDQSQDLHLLPQNQIHQNVPQQQPPERHGYTHVDVTSAAMKLNGTGEQFDGASKDEYDDIKQSMEQQRGGRRVKDREVRFEMMRRRIEQASLRRDVGGGDETMGLFTAPEWTLGKSLTKKDVRWYREQFKELSGQHPHMTIMPGTMMWQERVKKQHGLGKKTRMHNTGDVFHGGERIHTVNKRGQAGDVLGQRSRHGLGGRVQPDRALKWYNRTRDQAQGDTTFDVNGVKMGYEICADSSTKRVRNELNDKGQSPLDVHVVNGAGQPLDERSMALTQGGLGVASDSGSGQSEFTVAQESWDHQDESMEDVQKWHPDTRTYSTESKRTNLRTPVRMQSPQGQGDRTVTTAPQNYDPTYAHEHHGRHKLPPRL